MKRSTVIARVWLGFLIAATTLTVPLLLYLSEMAGLAVYDFNPEALQRLSEAEREGIVQTARMLMFWSAVPPLVLCVGWAITAIMARSRRRAAD